MVLGERLKLYRKNGKLTLMDLKEKSGLSVSYLSDLERGRTNPSLETLKTLAAIYQTNVSTLMEGVEGWGVEEQLDVPPSLLELKDDEEVGHLVTDDDLKELGRISLRGQQPKTKLEWKQLYLYLNNLLPGDK